MIFTNTKIALGNLLDAAKLTMAKKDIRYWFNGVALYFYKGRLCHIVSTDGHQLIKFTIQRNVSLPQCDEVRVVDRDFVDTLISVSGGMFASDYASDLLSQEWLVDCRYPDITRVLPKKHRKDVTNEVGLDFRYVAGIKGVSNRLRKGYKLTSGEVSMIYMWKFGLGTASESVVAYKDFYVNGCGGVSAEYVIVPVRLA